MSTWLTDQKEGLGFPQVRCLITTCLATGCIVHYNTAAMKGKLLDSKQYSVEDIAELYGLRWDVETDIASWKTTMGYCDLRCQKPENLDREIAVGVLAYNLVRLLMNDAAAVLVIHPREISFSRSRDAWISFSDELETSVDLMWIVLSSTSRLVRDRPGREEPRELKRRNQSKYPKLKVPRPSRAKRIAAENVKLPDKP